MLTGTGIGLHVMADHWRLSGFTVADAQKGIVLDGASYNVLDGLTVRDIDQEAVHLRRLSSDNTITRSTFRNTGRTIIPGSRAVTIGSTANLWPSLTGGLPDRSDRNRVTSNTFGPDLRGGVVLAAEGTARRRDLR